MSQINYANATFNKVTLERSDFQDKEAVTASCVDTKIDNLVHGASPSFDTLKELSLALSNGDDVAVAVTSQISNLNLDLNNATAARVAYESANRPEQRLFTVNICGYNYSFESSCL